MKKRAESLVTVLMFLALAFLVFRDASQHAVFQVPMNYGAAPATAEPAAARAEVTKQCDGAGGCDAISFLGLTPETQNRYAIAVYIVDRHDNGEAEHYVVLVALEGGKVVASKAE